MKERFMNPARPYRLLLLPVLIPTQFVFVVFSFLLYAGLEFQDKLCDVSGKLWDALLYDEKI